MKLSWPWQAQEAKANFSALIKAAQDAPQLVTLRDERVAVVMSYKQFERLNENTISIGELLDKSPLKGFNLEVTRDLSSDRNVDLNL